MSNSMVQDIKELTLAGIGKECFMMIMILDLIFEGSIRYTILFIFLFWRILRKSSSLEEGTYFKEVVHKLECRIPSSPPIPPTIYSLLSLFSSQPSSPLCIVFIGLCHPLHYRCNESRLRLSVHSSILSTRNVPGTSQGLKKYF